MISKLIPTNNSSLGSEKLIREGAPIGSNKILIVEDNPVALEILEKSLSDSGYSIQVAVSGEDFFGKISHDYSMVILDLNLPDVDGYTCLNFVNKYFQEIPVLVLSSSGTKDAVLSIQHGAVDYIQKPICTDDLVKTIQQHVTSKKITYAQQKFNDLRELLVGESQASAALIKEIEAQPLSNYLLFTGGIGKYSLAKLLAQEPYFDKARYITYDCQERDLDTLKLILKSKIKTTFILRNIEYSNVKQISFLIKELSKSHNLFLTSKLSLKTLNQFACNQLIKHYQFQHFHVPSIKERREDFPSIISRIMQETEFKSCSLSDHNIDRLINADWESVDELEDYLKTNLQFPNAEDSSSKGRKYANIVGLSLNEIERIAILETIEACNGNKSKAAKILQITEKTIYNKLNKYG